MRSRFPCSPLRESRLCRMETERTEPADPGVEVEDADFTLTGTADVQLETGERIEDIHERTAPLGPEHRDAIVSRLEPAVFTLGVEGSPVEPTVPAIPHGELGPAAFTLGLESTVPAAPPAAVEGPVGVLPPAVFTLGAEGTVAAVPPTTEAGPESAVLNMPHIRALASRPALQAEAIRLAANTERFRPPVPINVRAVPRDQAVAYVIQCVQYMFVSRAEQRWLQQQEAVPGNADVRAALAARRTEIEATRARCITDIRAAREAGLLNGVTLPTAPPAPVREETRPARPPAVPETPAEVLTFRASFAAAIARLPEGGAASGGITLSVRNAIQTAYDLLPLTAREGEHAAMIEAARTRGYTLAITDGRISLRRRGASSRSVDPPREESRPADPPAETEPFAVRERREVEASITRIIATLAVDGAATDPQIKAAAAELSTLFAGTINRAERIPFLRSAAADRGYTATLDTAVGTVTLARAPRRVEFSETERLRLEGLATATERETTSANNRVEARWASPGYGAIINSEARTETLRLIGLVFTAINAELAVLDQIDVSAAPAAFKERYAARRAALIELRGSNNVRQEIVQAVEARDRPEAAPENPEYVGQFPSIHNLKAMFDAAGPLLPSGARFEARNAGQRELLRRLENVRGTVPAEWIRSTAGLGPQGVVRANRMLAGQDPETGARIPGARNYGITLEATDDPEALSMVSIFDAQFQWTVQANRLDAGQVRGTPLEGYQSMYMRNAEFHRTSWRPPDGSPTRPVIELGTRTRDGTRDGPRDRVFIMEVNQPPTAGFGALDIATGVMTAGLTEDRRYGGAIMPMVKQEERINLQWMNGMRAGRQSIQQAQMVNRLAINEYGARAETATTAIVAFAGGPGPYTVGREFVFWIVPAGQTTPVYATYVSKDNWRDPGSLRS